MESFDKRSLSSVSVPCTCGELFQGSIEGEPCLVSCPIDRYSTARLYAPQDDFIAPGEKARQALSMLDQGEGLRDTLSIRNPMPPGRGFGTSTADIGAALFAASKRLGSRLSATKAAQIAVKVEPSDSTLFPGLTLFAHRTGNFNEFLGPVPAAKILIVDPGGFVDTMQFNAHDWSSALARLAAEHRKALDMLKAGIQHADLEAIGQAATLDAQLHQAILLCPLLGTMQEIARQIHAAGICRAHSGTICGFLLDNEREDEKDIIAFCKQRMPLHTQFSFARLVGGGAG